MRKKIKIIFQDAHGFIEYRNRVYNSKMVWSTSSFFKLKILCHLFRSNQNGFRDLFYYRIGGGLIARLLKKIYKPTCNLVLDVGFIPPGGCMFHHAFSSYINADYVGCQCSFRNNITVGNKIINGEVYRPYIEDNVFIGPNVVIIGKVRIGHHSVIGAGAVVTKDLPPYSVAAGNPARIIKTLADK